MNQEKLQDVLLEIVLPEDRDVAVRALLIVAGTLLMHTSGTELTAEYFHGLADLIEQQGHLQH